jgi:hypothetical protein
MRCEADLSFALRAYLKMKPLYSLIFCMIFVVVIFGTGIHLVEFTNNYMLDLTTSDVTSQASVGYMKNFKNLYNSLWLVVVTMTTIGYGDIAPISYFGRVLAMIACILGIFFLSLVTVFLNNSISFDEVEKHVYEAIIQEKYKLKDIEKEAAKVILKSFEYNLLLRRYPKQTALYRFKILEIDMKYIIRNFKIKRM